MILALIHEFRKEFLAVQEYVQLQLLVVGN